MDRKEPFRVPLAAEKFEMLRHPGENGRFGLALCVSAILALAALFIAIASSGVILFFVAVFLFTFWFALKLVEAHLMTNFVRVSQVSFPEIHRAIEDAKALFGYEGTVHAYLMDEGDYDLFIIPFLTNKYLLVHTSLLSGDTYEKQMRFTVARYVGALATRKYPFALLQVFIEASERLLVFNFLLFPYERATQYTGDRMGLRMVGGDLHVAVDALMRMRVGPTLSARTHPLAYVNQMRNARRSLFVWLTRAFCTIRSASKA